MCHRYRLDSTAQEIAEYFDAPEYSSLFLDDAAVEKVDRYPFYNVPVIVQEDAGRRVKRFMWRLLPHWWKPSPKFPKWRKFLNTYPTFNAKSEDVHQKNSFRDAFAHRHGGRALVPANAFFEHGYFFSLKDQPLFAFAGLWDCWTSEEEEIYSCTILTTTANDLVAEVHPRKRMPVILDSDESFSVWLDPSLTTREPLERLLRPYESTLMKRFALDT